MKKFLSIVLAVLMVAGCCAALSSCSKDSETIKIGLSGPLTGDAAVYGLGVANAAQMAVDEINEKGGLNGIKLELKAMDDVNDKSKVQNNYAELISWGMQISLGCVTTQPALEFKTLSKEDNVFFMTPSASADAVRAESNGYQMCFADAKQGVAAANYVNTLNLSKIGIFYQSDLDYSTGIRNEFKANLSTGITVVEASFTTQTASNFETQIAQLRECEFIFMPIYYTPAALFMTQAKAETGIKTYYGCDGFDGIESAKGFTISEIPQKITMLTHFNSAATEGAAKTFIDNYTAKYGADTLNQFGASAYDCVYAIFGALKKAVEEGKTVDASTSASDMCEILKAQLNGGYEYTGAVTGTGTVKWTAEGFVNKEALVHVIKEANS
ncbi:MAG: ABC transporter substrate-binding protein [Clostridia bacterium]|nr:ABC transporter substrate-binding protein [Clostridia bacterium]